MEKNRTEINDIGEFGLINRISKDIVLKHENSVLGIGDDSALIDIGNQYLCISSDMLIENIHFDLTYFPLRHLGHKAVTINVADIAAMNAKTEQITVNIGISNKFSVEAIEELYQGIKDACNFYNIDLIGGDTTASKKGLIISITAIGTIEKNKVTKRSGAKENEIICVTGDLGAAYLGLQILKREKSIFLENPEIQPELENNKYIVQRQMMPKARLDILQKLEKENILPTSMIDISDGLASDIIHIAQMSNVGVEIFEEKVPISQETLEAAKILNIDPLVCAFNGGEDYELLFTIKQKDFEKIKKVPEINYIGYINNKEEGINLITKDKQKVKIEAQGWKST